MNKREADFLEDALKVLKDDSYGEIADRIDSAIRSIEGALHVRTILPVCQVCLKIGGCDHLKK